MELLKRVRKSNIWKLILFWVIILNMEYMKFIHAEVQICMTLSYSTINAIAEKYSIMC